MAINISVLSYNVKRVKPLSSDISQQVFKQNFIKNLEFFFLIICRYVGIGQNISRPTVPLTNLQKVSDICECFSSGKGIAHTLARRAAFFLSSGEPHLALRKAPHPFTILVFIYYLSYQIIPTSLCVRNKLEISIFYFQLQAIFKRS